MPENNPPPLETSSLDIDLHIARRDLVKALGVDVAALSLHERAAFEALCEEVIALRQEANELRDELGAAELLADHDALCPIFNRRAFEREVRREIALAGRFATPLSLIYIDLDGFKQVNDIFGHSVGDDVLIKVSHILLLNTRETDIVGRLGGDEFGIVLAQSTPSGSAAKAEQLTRALDNLAVRSEGDKSKPIESGGSCGVATWRPGQSAAQLIAHADQAMFARKAKRKTVRPST